jgi:hypothetical protein
MSDSEDPIDLVDEEGGDLFGDEDDAGSDLGQVLSDKDLASDQDDADLEPRDEDRYEQPQVRDKVIMGVNVARHRIPKSKDGTVSPSLELDVLGIGSLTRRLHSFKPSKSPTSSSSIQSGTTPRLGSQPRPISRTQGAVSPSQQFDFARTRRRANCRATPLSTNGVTGL